MIPTSENFVQGLRQAIARPPEGVDAGFRSYYPELVDDPGIRKYIRAKEQLLELGGGLACVRGRTVLDAGSGFGLVANLMAAWGARQAIALEIFAPMAGSHRRLLDTHFPHLREIVLPVRGDAQTMPVKSASVDLLLSIEAVSHYYDVDAFLDECARVMRPGGVLLISDGNNGANPALRRFTEQLWERFEAGPTGPFGEHVVEETMVARRASIIAARFPELAPERVRSLAEATSGMLRPEIEQAVASHLSGGPAPAARYRSGMVPRDPHWGSVAEALFDPRVLAAQIERRGFQARAIPHYGGARNRLILAADRVLRLVPSFRLARAFRIAARRR
jgi:SAM-dependent methyltransferase